MKTQQDLQNLLVELLGSSNVYFQPPPTVKMQYPCIVYKRDFVQTTFSGNKPYNREKRYLVTVIDKDPNSAIPDLVGSLPKCIFDRFFTADGLNHDIFRLFF